MTNVTRNPRVVIVGAGFGGLTAAKALAKAPVEVTLIDKRNYHLFQPLLYQVATASLSPADVAWPIRSIFTRKPNVEVMLAKLEAVDKERKEVAAGDLRLPYDYLIIATGSHHSYFGHDEWAQYAPGLKRIIDATEIRKRILVAFERAEIAKTDAEREREMTFVIVGGGPTGVELAGAIAELARHALARDFRHINPRAARILLVEAGDRILPALSPRLSEYAQSALEKLGVEVMLKSYVSIESDYGATMGDKVIPAATMIWAAGVTIPQVKDWLGAKADKSGHILVEPDLSIPGHPDIFVIGDAASVPWKDDVTVPGIAPAAKQEGSYVAKLIKADLKGERASVKPFKYKHSGNLATIGRNAAIADFGWMTLTGFPAWLLWSVAHIYFLIGVRAPTMVALQWLWSYITYGKGARLITGLAPVFEPVEPPANALAKDAA
jgi:NADH dehydrogenase